MGQTVLPGNPQIPITLKRSARARRMSLRVSGLDGRVTLSIPRWTSEREAMAFVREKESWIRDTLGKRPEEIVPRVGGAILFEGREVPLLAGRARGARYETGGILVPAGREGPALAGFLKTLARQRLAEASGRYAGLVGRPVTRITLRDTRSRWGSCSSNGSLMYSWRLIMAPPDVLDYVAAHEVAHLVEMNHSAAYWALVDWIRPGYQAPRRWLRENGALLHRYRFGD